MGHLGVWLYLVSKTALCTSIMIILVKCWALRGERERRGRHNSDKQTVQHSVQQPGRTLLFLY